MRSRVALQRHVARSRSCHASARGRTPCGSDTRLRARRRSRTSAPGGQTSAARARSQPGVGAVGLHSPRWCWFNATCGRLTAISGTRTSAAAVACAGKLAVAREEARRRRARGERQGRRPGRMFAAKPKPSPATTYPVVVVRRSPMTPTPAASNVGKSDSGNWKWSRQKTKRTPVEGEHARPARVRTRKDRPREPRRHDDAQGRCEHGAEDPDDRDVADVERVGDGLEQEVEERERVASDRVVERVEREHPVLAEELSAIPVALGVLVEAVIAIAPEVRQVDDATSAKHAGSART